MSKPSGFQIADEDMTSEVSGAVNKLLATLMTEVSGGKASREMPASFMAACASVLSAVVAVRVATIQTSYDGITPEIILKTIARMSIANLPEAIRIANAEKAPTAAGTRTLQ